jgi:DNA-directed RNA polymerase sigma subunit (sigma70/sigma32)
MEKTAELTKDEWKSKRDEELVLSLNEHHDEPALKELIDRHSGICIDVCNKYGAHPMAMGANTDELMKSKDYVIYQAAQSFDPTRGAKFSTWVGHQMRFYCLNTINKSQRNLLLEEETLHYLIDKNAEENASSRLDGEKEEVLEFIKNILSQLNDQNIKHVVQERYFNSERRLKTFTEIAKDRKTTVQTVINWHNKFLQIVKNKLTSQEISDIL